jgi:hypothetical protein
LYAVDKLTARTQNEPMRNTYPRNAFWPDMSASAMMFMERKKFHREVPDFDNV